MRVSYTEEESYPGEFFLWQANCGRSINGRSSPPRSLNYSTVKCTNL